MYAPHTVSLMNRHGDGWRLTVLRGVMLQTAEYRSVVQRSGRDEAGAALYIPDCSGFLPPKDYAALEEPGGHWTLQTEGENAGRSSFFLPGEVSAPLSPEEARKRYDRVYMVTGWALHDYGSAAVRHLEVRTKITGRYYYAG